MRPTLLQHAGAWIPLLPLLLAVLSFRRLSPARIWIAAWCALLVAQDAIGFTMGMRGINNLWVGYVFQPVLGGVGLWALSHWQPDDMTRAGLRYAVPLVVVVNIILILAIEDRRTFSLVASPFHYITLLLASLWTFVRLSLASDESLAKQDWFWITGGLMLFAATSTAIGPLAWYLLRPRVDLLHAMLNVRAASNILAFAAITWGMLCPRQRYSGGFSSRPFSPSSSSSPVSGSRW